MLRFSDPDAFAAALLADMPAPPTEQGRIVDLNRSGRVEASV